MIRASSPNPTEHDFTIWTDGSGFDFGYAGASSIILNNRTQQKDVRLTASYAHTTHRAEFDGLLSGLQCVMEMGGWDSASKKEELDALPRKLKPSVCWFGDNESLILAAWRWNNENDSYPGEPFYRRRSSGDLWARFSYYESALRITPLYIPRNSQPEHALADRLAGESRMVLKDYMEVLLEEKVI